MNLYEVSSTTSLNHSNVIEDQSLTVCPECGSSDVSSKSSETVCSKCGLVIEEQAVDLGPEWRSFDAQDLAKKSRVGTPVTYTLHDKGLLTTIDRANKDTHGTSLTPAAREQMYRLRRAQNRSKVSTSAEKNLVFALQELDRIESHLGLPRNVRETAAVIYRKAVAKRIIRGRSIDSIVAAAIYAACKQYKIPRTLDEISEASQIEKKEIARSYRHLMKTLKLEVPQTSPEDYISRFATDLDLSAEVRTRSIDILKKASENGLTSGRGPMGVAAASLYIATVMAGEKRTQREIADVARVTEVTVRNRYKELISKLKIEPEL